jgi:hypothetical protein
MRTTFFALTSAVLLLTAPSATAQECSEEVVIETFAGTIVVEHVEALFNCCAGLDVEVVQDGFEIGIFEWEVYDIGPCYCLCCFGAEATVAGLPPGDYSISVWKVHDNFDGTWTHELVGTWLVPVSGDSEPSVETSYAPCVETGALEPDWSWGTIKALFR